MKVCIVVGNGPNMKCGVGDYTGILYNYLKELMETHLIISRSRKIWRIVQTVKKLTPHIITIQYPSKDERIPLLLFLFKILLPRIPVVTTLHEFKNVRIVRTIITIPLVLLSHKVIVSQAIEKDFISRLLPMVGSKIEVIPIAANIIPRDLLNEERETLAKKLFRHNGELLIGYFGFIRPDKNIEDLLVSFKELLEKGHSARLVLITELDMKFRYHRRIKELINNLGIQDRTIITGYCGPMEISRHLASLNMAVFPFQRGITLNRGSFLAAISHSLPVVTTRGKRIPEGLISYKNVLLASAGKRGELTQQIEELINSESLRVRLSEGARSLAKRFNWPDMSRRYLQLYRSVAE